MSDIVRFAPSACNSQPWYVSFMDICLEHRGIGFEKKLYPDDGEDKEFVLNAVYKITPRCVDSTLSASMVG